MQGFVEFLKGLGAARLAAMAAVTAALIGFFAFIILRVTAPQMVPLFTDLPVQDSGAIVKELERQGIPYEIRQDGGTILVPKQHVLRLRMKLAEGGLPKGGGIGYELFDKTDTLGATSFVQNINHLRALEGELARTIRSLDRVEVARVHLVLPERPLFSREKVEPSASIMLRLRGSLEPHQVRAIRHLVATAVSGLKPERISIVDEGGRLLADGAAGSDGGLAGGLDERQVAFERRLREKIESIVSSVVGPGRARVQLATEFDFNRITQTSDRFDPDGRVVRSSQTREEISAGAETGGLVSVSNELPGANQRPTEGSAREQSRKSEEIVNYEISRTTKTEVIEGGRIKRISVAVLVDGIYGRNERGESIYQPRSAEELDRIAALVRSAIGFDQRRGDQVEVVNLRFAEPPTPLINEPAPWLSFLSFGKDDIARVIELAILAVLALAVVMFVVRPLVRRVVTADVPALPAPPAPPSAPAAAEGGETPPPAMPAAPNHTAQMIDIAQVKGQVHAQSIQKVGELVERNPHETVAILRQWLHDTRAA